MLLENRQYKPTTPLSGAAV